MLSEREVEIVDGKRRVGYGTSRADTHLTVFAVARQD
jgi:hypothetical protein